MDVRPCVVTNALPLPELDDELSFDDGWLVLGVVLVTGGPSGRGCAAVPAQLSESALRPGTWVQTRVPAHCHDTRTVIRVTSWPGAYAAERSADRQPLDARRGVVDVLSPGGERVAQRSDAVLARRSGLGDRVAFAELVDRHGPALYRYAVRMLDGEHHAAEDAVQEALTKAWVHLGAFRGESSVKTWLFRLVANECLSARRRRRPRPVDDAVLTAIPDDARAAPETVTVATDLRAALDVALVELPWRQRASWILREVESLSYAEIAEVLGTSSTVVRGQLHRARANLAVTMEQWR